MKIINFNLNIIVIRMKELIDYEGILRMTISYELSIDCKGLVDVFEYVQHKDYFFWIH